MNVELTLEKITEENKKEKLLNMIKALSLLLNIPIDINDEGILEKAKLHKYISKEFINGQWHYRYTGNKKQHIDGKVEVCNSKPLKVTSENAKRVGEQFLIKPEGKKYISVIKKAISKLLHRDDFKGWDAMDDGILYDTSKNSKRYPNIILEMTNVTNKNKHDKLMKAIRLVAKQLKLPVGVEEVVKQKERCIYPVQEELLNYWTSFYRKLLDELYISITNIFDLPSIESIKKSNNFVMRKANEINKIKPLMYNGKIIYNADTGKPIDKKDFDAFIKAIEAFLNQNTRDISKHIILDSVAISKILKRIAKYSTTKRMQELTLNNLKIKEKTFDWIREEYKNLYNVLGEPLTRKEMASYQVCEDYATKLITRVNEDVREDIKNIFLDGIKNKKTKAQISQDLFDKSGEHNRNWKRIVETESVNISNLASVLEDVQHSEEGKKVYFERYEMGDACPICKGLHGTIALWTDKVLADDKIDDEYASIAIWEGKESDVKKGVVGIGTMHPHCRGFWVKWDTDSFDATIAKINGKEQEWDNAVEAVKEEYKQNGNNQPDEDSFIFRLKVQDKYRLASY